MSEGTNLGVGVWAMVAGLIVAVLSGLALAAMGDFAFVASQQSRQTATVVGIAFLAGVGLTVVGMVTAVAERTIDYVTSSEGA